MLLFKLYCIQSICIQPKSTTNGSFDEVPKNMVGEPCYWKALLQTISMPYSWTLKARAVMRLVKRIPRLGRHSSSLHIIAAAATSQQIMILLRRSIVKMRKTSPHHTIAVNISNHRWLVRNSIPWDRIIFGKYGSRWTASSRIEQEHKTAESRDPPGK